MQSGIVIWITAVPILHQCMTMAIVYCLYNYSRANIAPMYDYGNCVLSLLVFILVPAPTYIMGLVPAYLNYL